MVHNRPMFWTIPTLMTWTRIVAIPLIVGVYYFPGLTPAAQNEIATIMFVLFAVTDWLDGYLARRLNQTSAFGAFLDPVADKFLVCASLLIRFTQGPEQRLIWNSRQGRVRLANTVSSQVRSRNTFWISWIDSLTAQALGKGPK